MMLFLQQLSRKSLYILGLVAVAMIGSGYMTWMTVQDAGAKLSLDAQKQSATEALNRVTLATNMESVKGELAAVQAQLKEVSFPEQAPGVELVAMLVRASKEVGVELGNLQVLAVEQEKVGTNSYNVTRQRLQVRGGPTQVAGFLSRLEKGEFRSLVINNLSIAPQGGTWEARIDMYLYSTR